MKEFQGDSDRALVVLTGARLDFQLEQILQKYLVPSASASDDFFSNQGPASSFSNRIQLAYRLGLIDGQFVQSLNMIRRIRNEFAHMASKCSLDGGSYRDQVRALSAPYKKLAAYDLMQNGFMTGTGPVRMEYECVVGILLIGLMRLFEKVTPINKDSAQQAITERMRQVKGRIPFQTEAKRTASPRGPAAE